MASNCPLPTFPTLLGGLSKDRQASGLNCGKLVLQPKPALRKPPIMPPLKLPELGSQQGPTERCTSAPLKSTQKFHTGEASSAPCSVRRHYSSLSNSSSRSELSMQSLQVPRRRPSAPLKLRAKVGSNSSSRASSPSSPKRACSLPGSARSNRSIAMTKQRQEPRDVAMIRLVTAEAKRRHLNRPTFQRRQAGQQAEEDHITKGPTLWKMHQAKDILREAMLDVFGAVKACSLAAASVKQLQRLADERKEQESIKSDLMQRLQQQLPKLKAVAAFRKQLQESRDVESEWSGLASTMNHVDTAA